MFKNDFLEFTSNIHPVTPFVVYIPLVVGLLAHGLIHGLTRWTAVLVFFPLGWVTWDLAEYVIHRWWFHWEGNGPFTRKLHDIIHGYHHLYPDDALRLVMPLGASIPLALLIGGGLYLVGAPNVTIPWLRRVRLRLPVLRLHPLVHACANSAHGLGEGDPLAPHGAPLRGPGQELRDQPPLDRRGGGDAPPPRPARHRAGFARGGLALLDCSRTFPTVNRLTARAHGSGRTGADRGSGLP
jgi:hypothetical protein